MLTKDIKMDFLHLMPIIFASWTQFYQHEECHQRGKNFFFPLYMYYIYIKKENITWKITSLCNLCIFRTVEASGALVLS